MAESNGRSSGTQQRGGQRDRRTDSRSARGSERPFRGGGGGRRRFRRPIRKACSHDHITYKNVNGLRQYMTEQGKILPSRKTGLCARCQRRLALAIKRSRHLALIPYVVATPRLTE